MSSELKFTLVLDGRQYTGTLAAAEEATQRFTETAANGGRRASEALSGMGSAAQSAASNTGRASDALRGMTDQAGAAAAAASKAGDALRRMTQVEKLDAARDILGIRSFHDIQREIDQTTAAYNRLANSGKLSAQELATANQAHQNAVTRLKAEMQGVQPAMHGAAGAAGNLSQAMRMLPMQMTDVAVSLASGMPVWMVAIQQGGQLKDSFGGVGAAARAVVGYVGALIGPVTVAGAALAGLGAAFFAGRAEAEAYAQALIKTGGYAGVTAGQMQQMAAAMETTTVSQHAASEALAVMAGTGRISGDMLQSLASAAAEWAHVSGESVDDVAKRFVDIGKDPVGAIVKLDETMHFLTDTVYEQIKALDDEGRKTEAAKVAQDAYASALSKRAGEMSASLGTLQSAWRTLAGAASSAWSAMLNVGRPETPESALGAARDELAKLQAAAAKGPRKGWFGELINDGPDMAAIGNAQARVRELEGKANTEAKKAADTAAAAAKVQAKAAWDKSGDAYTSKKARQEDEIKKARQQAAEAGVSQDALNERIAGINEKYKGRGARKGGGSGVKGFSREQSALVSLADAQAKADRQIAIDATEAERAELERRYGMGLVLASDYYSNLRTLASRDNSERLTAIDREISAETSRKTKNAGEATARQAKLIDLQAKRAHEVAAGAAKDAAIEGQARKLAFDQSRADAQQWAVTMESSRQQVEQYAEQAARTSAQAIADPLARANAEADIAAAGVLRSAKKMQTDLGNEVDILRGRALQAAEAQAALLARAASTPNVERSSELYAQAAEQAQQQAMLTARADALQSRLTALNAGTEDAARSASAKPAVDAANAAEQRALAARDEYRALELSRSGNLSLAQAVEQVAIARLIESRASAEAAGNTARADAINREIAARKELGDLSTLKEYLGADVGTQLADGFDQASQSLSAFARSFQAVINGQQDYARARAAAGTDAGRLAAVESKHLQAQVNGYATMAGAAKGFFKQHTAGYKLMEAAEYGFRAVEMMLSVKSAAEKLGLIGAVTAAKVAGDETQAASAATSSAAQAAAAMAAGAANAVAGVANQANGDPYSAFPRMAAMAAIMAALGFATGAIGGGRSTEPPKTNSGTGTVLGSKEAQSESIAKSMALLANVDTLTMEYSAQMASSLRNIEANIGGVSNLLARSGAVGEAAAKSITGFQRDGIGNFLARFDAIGKTLSNAPIIGGLIAKGAERLANLFGTQRSVAAQGIYGGAQSLADIQAKGFAASYYADIKSTKKFFGITTGTSTGTDYTNADGELKRQFANIINGFVDTVTSAADPLGVPVDQMRAALSGYVVDLGKIDLTGLSGEDVGKKLTAVFGAEGDKIARMAVGGLDDFQRVGEGYLETVVRVAGATEGARDMIGRLGIQAAALGDIANKQGDIGAELVRQSIVAAESAAGSAGSLGKVIDTLQGTADQLASTYKTLRDIRLVLTTVGVSGEAVTSALVRGAGGLDALKTGAADFESKFLSASEQTAIKTARVAAEFSRLGLSVPASADAFKALVQGVDSTTEAGQAQLGGLLALSSTLSEFLGTTAEAAKSSSDVASERAGLEEQLLQLQGDTAALRARELAKLDSSNRALQERIWALDDEKKASEALASAGKGVAAYIDELRGVTGSGASINQRRATYQADLAAAQAGDADASGRVVSSAKSLVDAVKASASDPLAVARETSRIAADLQGLPAAVAYANQQAAIAGAKQAAPAGTSTPVVTAATPESVATVLTVSSTTTAAKSTTVETVESLMARLIEQVATLRTEQAAQGATIAANTGKAARILEGVTPDGDALSTRSAR